jgi:3',5'-cyclic AMP phosphodiesterase CpdA
VRKQRPNEFTFVQISDSHLGFDKPANPNVTATLQEALDDVGKLPKRPAFMIHTGDITHLSKPAQFDTAAQLCGGTKLTMHTVPGEHDILEEEGKSYLNRFGKGTKGDGWYSFDAEGVHFIGLVNVVNLQGSGLGNLGHDQLEWLEDDVKHLSARVSAGVTHARGLTRLFAIPIDPAEMARHYVLSTEDLTVTLARRSERLPAARAGQCAREAILVVDGL